MDWVTPGAAEDKHQALQESKRQEVQRQLNAA